MKRNIIYVVICSFSLLIGCGKEPIKQISEQQSVNTTTGNPTAQEVLRMDSNANIFMYRDTIYNAGVSWVDELNLTKDVQVTEISHQSNVSKDFKNGTANKLEVGTKIFRVKERNDILIVETEKGDIRFYQLVEG
ncbi:hypothetical protein A8990_12655 [Paenibacillus taihuensis]|uniref:Uncharacterized protein n=1 Tax=Paenibacillus taihuensis TaxID=1156355 RepID=A0A3D9RR61_9BACL|nr:hypothetical protein [Paenibacillus taihuensis]REE78581.1 hypothetical protein A8990_12655 [Paenibacillus taihuensis]